MDFVSNSFKTKATLFFYLTFCLFVIVFLVVMLPEELNGVGIATFFILSILEIVLLGLILQVRLSFKIENNSLLVKRFGKIIKYDFSELQNLRFRAFGEIPIYKFIFDGEKRAFYLILDEKTKNMFETFFGTFFQEFFKQKCNEFENTSRNLAVPKKMKRNAYIIDFCSFVFGFVSLIPFSRFYFGTILGLVLIVFTVSSFIKQIKLFRKAEKNNYIDKGGLHIDEKLIPFAEITAIEQFQKLLTGEEFVCFKTNSETYVFPMAFMQGDFVYQSYLMEKIKKQEVDSEQA